MAWGNVCLGIISTMVRSVGCRATSALVSALSSLTLMFTGLYLTLFFSLTEVFCPFNNTFPQRHPHAGRAAQPWHWRGHWIQLEPQVWHGAAWPLLTEQPCRGTDTQHNIFKLNSNQPCGGSMCCLLLPECEHRDIKCATSELNTPKRDRTASDYSLLSARQLCRICQIYVIYIG